MRLQIRRKWFEVSRDIEYKVIEYFPEIDSYIVMIDLSVL